MKDVMMLISLAIIPLFIAIIISHGLYKKVPVYEVFVRGAKQGISVGFRILPYLVAMMIAVGMFRASGALDILAGFLYLLQLL